MSCLTRSTSAPSANITATLGRSPNLAENLPSTHQACSLCVQPMGEVTLTQKRGRGGPLRNHEPHRHGPEGTAYPPPGPSIRRQPCVAGLKSRSAHGDREPGQSQNGRPSPREEGTNAVRLGQGGRGELHLPPHFRTSSLLALWPTQ